MMFRQFIRKNCQNAMENISHVHILELIFPALFQGQAILQKVRIGAGCILFQTADAVLQNSAVKRCRHLFGKRTLPIIIKRRID